MVRKEHIEAANEIPPYIKDFFDFNKADSVLPNLQFKNEKNESVEGFRLSSMPAATAISKVFLEFGEILESIYPHVDKDTARFRNLRNPIYMKAFYENLVYIFTTKVEPRIQRIKDDPVKETGFSIENFAPGWEDRIRYYAAWAFLVHRGQKREGEFDYNPITGESMGSKIDYVRHPLRAAFSETRPVSAGLLDELTIELIICHDIKEDFKKGFFGEKGLNLSDSVLSDLQAKIFQKMDSSYQPVLTESGDKFSDLVGIISKERKGGATREHHLIEFLDKVSSVENITTVHFMNLLRCFVAKVLDRLDNEQTSRYLKQNKPTTFEAMMHETGYVFYPAALLFGMMSASDWIADFVKLIDRNDWRPFFHSRKEAVKKYNPEAAFIEFFQERMLSYKEKLGFEPVYGKDYFIISRPRALRFREESVRRKSRRSTFGSVTSSGAKAMSRPFQHNIIVFPLTKDPEKNRRIASVAKEIFCNSFKSMDPEKYPHDAQTPLGNMFDYATDEGVDVHGRQKFGDVVYRVFNSPDDMRKVFYGHIHSAIIDGNENSVAFLYRAFLSISSYVKGLKFNIKTLNALEGAEGIMRATQNRISTVFNDGRDNFDLNLSVDQNQVTEVKKLLERSIYALFAGSTMSTSVKIIKKKGNSSEIYDFGFVSLPKGANIAYALMRIDARLIFSNISGCKVEASDGSFEIKNSSLAVNYIVKPGDAIEICVDDDCSDVKSNGPIQIDAARLSLDKFILPNIAKYYGLNLSDN